MIFAASAYDAGGGLVKLIKVSGVGATAEPSPKEYLERGRFEQPDRTREQAWPHPVMANGKLYIRDQDTLYCYDIKAKQQ